MPRRCTYHIDEDTDKGRVEADFWGKCGDLLRHLARYTRLWARAGMGSAYLGIGHALRNRDDAYCDPRDEIAIGPPCVYQRVRHNVRGRSYTQYALYLCIHPKMGNRLPMYSRHCRSSLGRCGGRANIYEFELTFRLGSPDMFRNQSLVETTGTESSGFSGVCLPDLLVFAICFLEMCERCFEDVPDM